MEKNIVSPEFRAPRQELPRREGLDPEHTPAAALSATALVEPRDDDRRRDLLKHRPRMHSVPFVCSGAWSGRFGRDAEHRRPLLFYQQLASGHR
jgi:hypothetical protein